MATQDTPSGLVAAGTLASRRRVPAFPVEPRERRPLDSTGVVVEGRQRIKLGLARRRAGQGQGDFGSVPGQVGFEPRVAFGARPHRAGADSQASGAPADRPWRAAGRRVRVGLDHSVRPHLGTAFEALDQRDAGRADTSRLLLRLIVQGRVDRPIERRYFVLPEAAPEHVPHCIEDGFSPHCRPAFRIEAKVLSTSRACRKILSRLQEKYVKTARVERG